MRVQRASRLVEKGSGSVTTKEWAGRRTASPNLNRSANRQAAKVRFKGPRKIADSRYHTYGFAILFACILIYMGLILTMGLSWKSYRDGYIAKSARGHYLVFPKGDNIRNRSSGL